MKTKTINKFLITAIIALGVIFMVEIKHVSASSTTDKTSATALNKLKINNKKWKYNSKTNVYYQTGISYGTKTVSKKYESMGIYVPGKYVTAKKNASGKTYTVKFNTKKKVKGYTSKTAPIVMPVNTPGYAAQKAPTGYKSEATTFTKAGFIYVLAGARGRGNTYTKSGKLAYSSGSPWGVTDLKAAVRDLRLNKSRLPGNTGRIFTFGHSGGGAQSSLMGSTGDSSLYTPYLKKIGAAITTKSGKKISDAIDGAMAWCPITSLDEADEAYEWNMGQFSSTGTRKSGTWTKELSNDMAKQYASYLNKLGLKTTKGTTLKLNDSGSGIYMSGSYYSYLKAEVTQSLNNFLKDTKFPYKQTTMSGPSGAAAQKGGKPGKKPSGQKSGKMPAAMGNQKSKTYKTVKSYIKSLNKNGTWVKYNAKTNTATITSLSAFVKHLKTASKDVTAFDGLTRNQTENQVFANKKSKGTHFDTNLDKLLVTNADKYSKYSGYKDYTSQFAADFKLKDSVGNTNETRSNMYNPMYYLSSYYSGYKKSKVAKHWRIRTGINQGDTALTTETNLKLALKNYAGVKDVDFATVWGQGHTEAERKGTANGNFIKWVNKSVKSE